jgi:calcineurin-like phosphoesterase family protein
VSELWFTGDTHFGSKRTLELSKRPFNSVEEMDEYMIDRWNRLVEDDDFVFHIGDFGDYSVCKRLKGSIILLLGNYEREDIRTGRETLESLRENYCFEKVYEQDILNLEDAENNLSLSLVHEPSKRNLDRFTLFGHVHGLQKVKKNALNVGVDCHWFRPITNAEVEFYKNAIQNHYDDEVFGK